MQLAKNNKLVGTKGRISDNKLTTEKEIKKLSGNILLLIFPIITGILHEFSSVFQPSNTLIIRRCFCDMLDINLNQTHK